MEEEKIKEAFSRVREDILNLGQEITDIKLQLLETAQLFKQINDEFIKLKLEKIAENNDFLIRNTPTETPTHPQKTPTHPVTPTETPTHPQEIQGLKSQNLAISIGNDGVPTDRQTDRQTNQQIFQHIISRNFSTKVSDLVTTQQEKSEKEKENVVTNHQKENISKQTVDIPDKVQRELIRETSLITKTVDIPDKVQRELIRETSLITEKPIQQQIQEASKILESLDNIKKEIRRKFKKITRQEMLVFSTIYELEEQYREVDYSKIALKLSLSQSSIRDYVQKMINKGIPITKEKLNNKKILLHISPELKKIASLNTIIQLREI